MLTKRQDYVMAYLHPSDFDPDQPKMDYLPLWNRWKNSVGLKGSYSKFCKYLKDFDFMSVEAADRIIDWSKVNLVKI